MHEVQGSGLHNAWSSGFRSALSMGARFRSVLCAECRFQPSSSASAYPSTSHLNLYTLPQLWPVHHHPTICTHAPLTLLSSLPLPLHFKASPTCLPFTSQQQARLQYLPEVCCHPLVNTEAGFLCLKVKLVSREHRVSTGGGEMPPRSDRKKSPGCEWDLIVRL